MILPDDQDRELLKVAFLLSRGTAQKAIAEKLHLTASKVSRLATRAFNEHVLERQHPMLNLTEDQISQLESEVHSFETLVGPLKRLSQGKCGAIEIIRPSSDPEDRQDYAREVADGAARFLVDEVLPGMHDVGLTWGAALRALCHELALLIGKEARSSQLDRGLTFHQCTGDTLVASGDPFQRAGTLVSELNHLLGTRGHTFSISAAIPKVFDGDLATIRRYIASVPGYSGMFRLADETTIELKKELDAIITSCGDGTSADSWRDECAKAAGIAPDRLTEMVVGNVGGTWIARSADFEEQVAEINHRWNGVSVRDLHRVVERGHEVVLIAAEPSKAEVVKRAVELGYVSTLICSFALITRINSLLSSRSP